MVKQIFLFTTSLLIFASCSIEQDPIRYGFDACDNCKMLIMDPKFCAIIFTEKGKTYKFDDTHCLLAYMNNNFPDEIGIASVSVIDYMNPASLIDATLANYVKSSQIKSPMASGIVAFSSPNDSKSFVDQWNGVALSWNEVKDNIE